MAHFSDDNLNGGYISSVEVENLQLREALVYAENGWREALALARKEQEKQRSDQNVMEIRSLQLELETVHKALYKSRTNEEQCIERLKKCNSTLESSLEEIIDSLGQSYRDSCGPAPLELEQHGESEEGVTLAFSVDKLDQSVKRAETILSFTREARIRQIAKEEAAKRKGRKKAAAVPAPAEPSKGKGGTGSK
jgi:hypothetical protein